MSENCADIPFHGVYGGLNPINGRAFMALFTERTPLPGELATKETELAGTHVPLLRTVGAVLHCDIGVLVSLRKWIDLQIKQATKVNPNLSTLVEDIENASME